ncbi:MAG TPA: ATP-binding protein [Thermoanaerobaculia bacterium]
MDETAPRRLTKLSFRRDVRLFLGALVGFLGILIVLLLLFLRSFLEHTTDSIAAERETIANVAAGDLAAGFDRNVAQLQLSAIRARYGVAGTAILMADGRRITTGVVPETEGVATVQRVTPAGTLILVFDEGRVRTLRGTFFLTAGVSLAAVAAGALLLWLYLPRITRPIEQMLDSAAEIRERAPHVDEQEYLIDTFRASIDLLKAQKQELQELHDAQKIRADDLERITSALTRSLTSGFLALDPNGNIVDLNASAREILRAGDAHLAGVQVSAALGTNDFTAALMNAVRDRAALTRAEIAVGSQLIGLTTVPLIDAGQRFLALLALFTDLTPYRELEARVRDLQTLADLGEISAGIAHEFRNSLSTMLGYLKLARRAGTLDDTARAIEKSEREAALLAEAVDRLLAFARPMKIDRHRIDLLELTREVCERIDAGEVPLTCGGAAVTVQGDRALLVRALDNLVRNAVDSVREKGSGAVRVVVADGDPPQVRVEDDGVGIDATDVPRLMLPFQSQKPNGYGLGLPLARKIVLLHGGAMRLTGEKGKGAVAVVELPR